MVRLFKIYVRPLYEYGNIALITASPKATNKWEIQQTKYIRKALNIRKLNNNITRKLAYLPKITNRIQYLRHKYYHKNKENNTPINKNKQNEKSL